MPSIGETLREARMRQRLDIADVEQRTKIRAKYLRALENEEFGMLPGPTFVKTFMRTYAETLGLDPHVLVEEYRATHEGEDELELQPLSPPSSAARDRYRGPRLGPGMLALLVLVGIVALLVAIGLLSDDGGGGEQAASPATTETRTAAKPKKKRRPAAPKRVALRVVPTTPVYVCVDHGAGMEPVFQDTIDSPQTFRGKRVRVNLGKRDVQLWKNGKRVQVVPGGEPIGFAFTPRHTRELPSGERPCL
jgi:cytoskeleton protein RodZ